MADVVTAAYTIIFIGILLVVGVVVFGTMAYQAGDQFHANEVVIAAGCSNTSVPSNGTNCVGTLNYPPFENVTRATAVIRNCSTSGGAGGTCQTLTSSNDYNLTSGGVLHVFDDVHNGTIFANYWEDVWGDSADNAQQSITGTAYGGFDLATVMVIVMAAIGIISTVFLIGKRGT